MESCLADIGKTYVDKLINKALSELRHLFCFRCIVSEFKQEKDSLEAEIKTFEQLAKVAEGRDKDIKANVLLWKEKADKIVQEDIKTKQTCFFGLCPDCIWRYKKGKKLASYIPEIKRLTEKGEKFENIELSRRLPGVERHSSKDYISFQSRESKFKELMDALKNDNNYIIVLQGMGGTGKTTLATEVGKELKKSEQFAHVIDTTVSFTPDTKKIQDDIAGSLGLTWENCNDSDRAKKLWSRLTNGEKILLILDDVWDTRPPLDFDLIGIPKRDNHKGCRALITTRNKQIFNKMDCDKIIELELLSEEEAWTMFQAYAGINNNSLKHVITTGRKIAKECKQLAVAITVIASSLKGQQDRNHEWDVTLNSLKKHVEMNNVDDEEVGIYKCLKVSYDHMKDEKAKGLFLLCSVFPEDKEIPIEILTRLGIGTSLLREDNGRYNYARAEIVVAKDKLLDNCLLMEAGKEHVKMHDLVREVAQWIANKEVQSVNLSNKDQKSSLERKINIKYLFCKGKDMDLFSCKYDGSKLEILIVDMEGDELHKCIEVPNSFFENIVKLQVLYFIGHNEQTISFPHSIQSLANIRSILVEGVDLGDISVLGNLHSLETLDLDRCKINELPHEIPMLGKFKVLNLEYCEIRRNDPFEVIKRCSTLEELYFVYSFNNFCREITLPKLQRYRIENNRFDADHDVPLSKCVSFDAGDNECFFSKETFKYCMQTAEGLYLSGIDEGWINLMPEIIPIDPGMKDLVELYLKDISQLQCLIDTTGSQVSNVFKLVVLVLHEMENLEELFNGYLPFDSLKNLEMLSIYWCKMLQRLFSCKLNLCNLKTVEVLKCPLLVDLSPLLTSRNLVLLEYLEIRDCERLTNIIIDERGEEESREEIGENEKYNKSYVSMFPKLKILIIERCPKLESIFPFLSSQDLPLLEHITIGNCDELKYIFGQYQQVELSSLKKIHFWYLPKFMGIFPKYSHSTPSHVNESSSTSRDDSEVQTQVDAIKCNIFSWSCICCHGNNYRHKHGSMSTTKISSPSVHVDPLHNNSSASVSNSHRLRLWERAQCFLVHSYFMRNIREIKLYGLSKTKSVFILSITPRMLVEELFIESCHDLEHIMVDTGDDESCGNNWGNVFPKLRTLYVYDCKKLEYIFGNYSDDYQNHNKIHIHLPTLQNLQLEILPSFVAMCPKQYFLTFPSLKMLEILGCSHNAIKYIGKFNIHSNAYSESDERITKELSESIEGQPMNLRLQNTELHDLHYMMCLFLVPKNYFSMQDLTSIAIVQCEILEIVFSTSILRCLPQLVSLRIEECKELKHIIRDDRHNQNLSSRTFFPKLEGLVIIKCHKLKSVFPVSVCKELPKLNSLCISEADELEEIFNSEHDQNFKIPNIDMVILINLPCLFHAQGIQLQTARNRIVQNCEKLSLTSTYTSFDYDELLSADIDSETMEMCWKLFQEIKSGKISHDTGNDVGVGVGIEVGAALGNNSTSSEIQMEQTLEADHECVQNASDLEKTSVAILPKNSKELEKEQPTSQQGLKNQQDLLGEINTTIQPSQANNGVEEGIADSRTLTTSIHLELVNSSHAVEEGTANVQTLTTPIHLELSSSSHELEREQPTSEPDLINQQNRFGEYNITF